MMRPTAMSADPTAKYVENGIPNNTMASNGS